MKDLKNVKVYALEQLREYLVINNVEVNERDDLIAVYLKMHKEGYFYKAEINDCINQVKATFSEFANAYEKDKDIMETDLIFMGARRVLEKMESNKNRR